MKYASRPGCLAALALTLAAAPAPGIQNAPTLESVLAAAAAYVAKYEAEAPGIVSEEHYTQTVSRAARRLRSDVLVIRVPDAGWVSFRDVFEVDGEPVRDRAERLSSLFLQPRGDPIRQARRIAAESARFNLQAGSVEVNRTINNPLLALRFLRRENQPRARFRLEGMKTLDGVRVALLRFEEQDKPRLIASNNDAPAQGRLWIEPATGRIVQTEVTMETRTPAGRYPILLNVKVRVRFGADPSLPVLVPLAMNEEYDVRNGRAAYVIRGKATYGNFRRFTVEVDTSIK